MGVTVSAKCECGYPHEIRIGYFPGDSGGSLRVGWGMCASGFYFPALCEACCQAVAVNLAISPWRCPSCKSQRVKPYFPDTSHGKKENAAMGIRCTLKLEDGGELIFELYEDATYTCPECGEATLTFETIGHWD